jgi:hypothetical protein
MPTAAADHVVTRRQAGGVPVQRLTDPAGAVPTVIVATSPHNLRCDRQPSSIMGAVARGGRVRSGSQNRPYVNLHTPLMLPIVPLLAEAIHRIHVGKSVSRLFDAT